MNLSSQKPIQQIINQESYKSKEAKENMEAFKRVAKAKVKVKDLKNVAMGNLKMNSKKTMQGLYASEYLMVASDKMLQQSVYVNQKGEKKETTIGRLMQGSVRGLGEETANRSMNSFQNFTDVMVDRANSFELSVEAEKEISKDKSMDKQKQKEDVFELDW